jgi:hypothetical protein
MTTAGLIKLPPNPMVDVVGSGVHYLLLLDFLKFPQEFLDNLTYLDFFRFDPTFTGRFFWKPTFIRFLI